MANMFSICKLRLEELTKIFLECQPNCEACDNLIYQLSQHIRATHVINETPGTFETIDYNEIHHNHDDQNSDENAPTNRSSSRLRVKKSKYYQEKYLSKPPKAEPQPVKKKIKVEILPFVTDTHTFSSTPYSANESDYNLTQDDYSEQGLDMDDVDMEYKCDVNLKIEGEEERVDSKVGQNPIVVEAGLDNSAPPIKPKPKRIRNRYHKGYPKLKLGRGKSSPGPHICSVCKIEYTKSIELIDHFQSEHKDSSLKPYGCTLCEKTFPRFTNLREHTDHVHLGKEFRHVCDTCNKRFPTKARLLIHLRSHSGEKPFDCGLCGKSFTRKVTYRFHMRIHLGDKPFTCEYCSKSFVRKDKLTTHLKLHTGERPHVCETCGKGFISLELLNIHIRNHTGEKPFMCEQCSKCFTTRRSLNSHIKTHENVKEFSCQQCGRAFTLKSQLVVHKKVHEEGPSPSDISDGAPAAVCHNSVNYNFESIGTLTNVEENFISSSNYARLDSTVFVPQSMDNFRFGF